jgi:hypothetical protein
VNVGGDTINITTPAPQIVVVPPVQPVQPGQDQTQAQTQTQSQTQQQQAQAAAPAAPSPAAAKPGAIALTGSSVDRGARIASGLVVLGLLLVLATWRSGGGPNLGFLFRGPGGPSGWPGGGGFGGGGFGGGSGGSGSGGWRRGGPGGLRREGGYGPLGGGLGRGDGDARPEPMAFSGTPTGVLPRTGPPPVDVLEEIFRPPAAPKRSSAPAPRAATPSPQARFDALASGLGLTAGPDPAAPAPAANPAARAALRALGLHLPRTR